MICCLRQLRNETALEAAPAHRRPARFRPEAASARLRSERQTRAERPTPLQCRPQPTDTLERSLVVLDFPARSEASGSPISPTARRSTRQYRNVLGRDQAMHAGRLGIIVPEAVVSNDTIAVL